MEGRGPGHMCFSRPRLFAGPEFAAPLEFGALIAGPVSQEARRALLFAADRSRKGESFRVGCVFV